MKYYKVSEVAKILSMSRITIWLWIKEGKIKAIRTPGGTYLIPESEVNRILAVDGG